jgi:hypothetical protein
MLPPEIEKIIQKAVPMKQVSPPGMKKVSSPTPHTLTPLFQVIRRIARSEEKSNYRKGLIVYPD